MVHYWECTAWLRSKPTKIPVHASKGQNGRASHSLLWLPSWCRTCSNWMHLGHGNGQSRNQKSNVYSTPAAKTSINFNIMHQWSISFASLNAPFSCLGSLSNGPWAHRHSIAFYLYCNYCISSSFASWSFSNSKVMGPVGRRIRRGWVPITEWSIPEKLFMIKYSLIPITWPRDQMEQPYI